MTIGQLEKKVRGLGVKITPPPALIPLAKQPTPRRVNAFMVKSKLKLAVFFSSENQKSGAVIR